MTIKQAMVVMAMLGVAAAPATASVPKGWKTYTDAKGGWSISYPANFTVDKTYQSNTVDPGVHGVAFNLPESWSTGTNLDDALVSVQVLPGTNCKPEKFVSDVEDLKTIKADGRTYLTTMMPDGGMMQQRNTTLFLIKGTCTAITYFVHSTERTVVDPMPREFDEKKLMKLFDSIRATFTLKK